MDAATVADGGLDVERLFRVIVGMRQGDFAVRMPTEGLRGRALEVANQLNRFVEQMADFNAQLTRLADEVGPQGKLGPQAELFMSPGPWKGTVDAVNGMSYVLTNQIRDLCATAHAAANGDYSRKVTVSAQGEMAGLTTNVNAMLDRLRAARNQPAATGA